MVIVDSARVVVGGVDTHLDEHVAAVVDGVGGVLGVARFAVTPAGYRQMLAWMHGHGRLERVGVEGSVTLKIYAHVMPGDDEAAARLAADAIFG